MGGGLTSGSPLHRTVRSGGSCAAGVGWVAVCLALYLHQVYATARKWCFRAFLLIFFRALFQIMLFLAFCLGSFSLKFGGWFQWSASAMSLCLLRGLCWLLCLLHGPILRT